MVDLETTIAGIPCIVRVTHYLDVPGCFSRNADSDLDYYGYTEIEWEVCDRRGRPAPWLDRKMTDKDEDRIRTEIHEAMSEKDYD